MPVTDVTTDPDTLTMSFTAQFDAAVGRLWRMWSDPRRLERWWGPPGYPATVTDHGIAPGDRVAYYMTGPDGERYHGWWRVVVAEPPHRLEFEDGFAGEDGEPDESMGTAVTRVSLEASAEQRTTMKLVGTFRTAEEMEQMVEMGVVEGMTAALGQIDGLLAEDPGG